MTETVGSEWHDRECGFRVVALLDANAQCLPLQITEACKSFASIKQTHLYINSCPSYYDNDHLT